MSGAAFDDLGRGGAVAQVGDEGESSGGQQGGGDDQGGDGVFHGEWVGLPYLLPNAMPNSDFRCMLVTE